MHSEKALFKKHAKTFSFAAFFLGRRTTEKVLTLYAFCRRIDDIADVGDDKDAAKAALETMHQSIKKGASDDDTLNHFIAFIQSNTIDQQYILHLLEGVISDCEASVRVKSEKALMHYCYQVAGTVGGAMCPLLNIKSSEALKPAIELGMAMQLTNIARDIKEDALNKRIYIPSEWLKIASPELLTKPPEEGGLDAREACATLLDRADTYYESAKEGYAYLPFRARLSIVIAASLYRAIGEKIRKNHYRYWQGRQFLTVTEKVARSIVLLSEFFKPHFWRKGVIDGKPFPVGMKDGID